MSKKTKKEREVRNIMSELRFIHSASSFNAHHHSHSRVVFFFFRLFFFLPENATEKSVSLSQMKLCCFIGTASTNMNLHIIQSIQLWSFHFKIIFHLFFFSLSAEKTRRGLRKNSVSLALFSVEMRHT